MSSDSLIGVCTNLLQCYWLLRVMAHITGHKAGKVFHKHVNYHIYSNQLDVLHEHGQLDRVPFELPTMRMPENLTCLEDLLDESKIHPKDFVIENYQHHDRIDYPFAV